MIGFFVVYKHHEEDAPLLYKRPIERAAWTQKQVVKT
jgi:hypothetical protein